MNPLPPKDTSLYELALSSDYAPSPLKISPTIFKSMLELLFNLLIEQDLPAQVWLKLPKGDVWRAELQRYLEVSTAPDPVYLLRNPKDIDVSPVEPPELVPLEEDIGDEEPILPPNHLSRPVLEIPLASDSRLRREYFVLAIAPNFCVLILAHRPRSVRQGISNEDTPLEPLPILSSKPSPEQEDVERRHPLLGLCTIDPKTVQTVFEGLQQAIAVGQAEAEPGTAVEPGLAHWDEFCRQLSTIALDPIQISRFCTLQIQRQEQIWHGNAATRRQAEAASTLQFENEELLNQIRLQNEFLKNVGQELRTPLANMKTALSLLNSPNLKTSQRQRYMDLLSQECDRQSSLITSVLDLIQLENIDDQTPLQPLRLVDVVPGVVSTYQPLAQEKGIMLAYTVPEELPTVSCLGNWLRQIVINLLHNAIRFTPKGGQVWVRARQQGDFVQLEFRDTGVGIAQSDLPKIFDRFYRVRHSGTDDISGVGLGLSIVQQLLLRCGGSISVKSKQGEGSSFSILLPLYNQESL